MVIESSGQVGEDHSLVNIGQHVEAVIEYDLKPGWRIFHDACVNVFMCLYCVVSGTRVTVKVTDLESKKTETSSSSSKPASKYIQGELWLRQYTIATQYNSSRVNHDN